MAYRYGNREQITFLPDSIENYVTEEDPARVYDAFVDALDLESLGIKVDDKTVGNSSYNPVTMLKILVYGYSYGWHFENYETYLRTINRSLTKASMSEWDFIGQDIFVVPKAFGRKVRSATVTR